ncbi:uncharacterized protein (DUF885 family) [Microcella alkaliphila]|uniref:Uncharacterized protein (DUF885 family) n=1 Tax=Microcella alkaliphila TaxID=279828 RepID=A0A4Q7TT19_9MICO|nr:DUF885 domain-containing protein [Microcella alkaliphila]RZT64144.1 uncharacterized protein (DUF885 family) [Microcella alkaliphila]
MTESTGAHEARTPTEIDRIAEEWVDTLVAFSPELATYIGADGDLERYQDYSPNGRAAIRGAANATIGKLEAVDPVDDTDRVTKTDLLAELRLDLELDDAGWEARDLNVLASPAQGIREIYDLMPTGTDDDWSTIAKKLTRVSDALDGYAETLREGIANGNTPAVRQVREVLTQVRTNASADGFFHELATGADVPDALKRDLLEGARQASDAYGRFGDFLENELAPAARADDPVGRELYELLSRRFLGATIDLDETYEWGIEELRRMVDEQTRIADQILPGASVEEAIAHLEKDPTRKLHGREALREWMQQLSDTAVDELSRTHFEIPEPVKKLECMIAPTPGGAIYYTGPTDDFSRPGRMWWSIPEGVDEFDTWRETTTVYHEGVPGHHLQIGQAVYNRAQLNSWRRLLAGTSGHAEGWALYAERLMEELGYLDDPADRLGMLDGQRMRAARVVLDIGVHLGKIHPETGQVWTSDDAFAFMRKNVNMNDGFVNFEVNRYLGWPGQAPSYKVGQRIWENLRAEITQREGADYSDKAFHKRALDIGGVGLDTLTFALLG